MKSAVLILASAVLLTVLGFQYRQASQLRAENRERSRIATAATEVKASLALIERQRSAQELADEIAKLRKENGDLFKLRNEIRQLREQNHEVENLRAENERLRAA